MTYKDTKPYTSVFLSVDLLTDFAAFCLTDFIDWRCIHSWFVFSTQLVNCCPHGRRNYTCVLLPLCCTFSLVLNVVKIPSLGYCKYKIFNSSWRNESFFNYIETFHFSYKKVQITSKCFGFDLKVLGLNRNLKLLLKQYWSTSNVSVSF